MKGYEILCEKCGSKMRTLDPQKPIGMTCDKCGWGWVTTYIEPIFSDTATYCLTVRKMNSPDAKALRVLANILNCNYIKAKEQVTTQDVKIADRATVIKEYAIMLWKSNIAFDISPDFPYEIKWDVESNMWHDNDKMVEVYNSVTDGVNMFPCECPVCNGDSVHLYIHDHGNGHSGFWTWCSECGAFAHMSGQTPEWWKNPVFIDGHELCAEPDYLEAHAVDIDEWVNSLVPIKKTKSHQPYVIEDRFNVIIKNDIQGILAGTRGVMVVKNDLKTVKVQFIHEDGQVVDITISQEELLQAVEVI